MSAVTFRRIGGHIVPIKVTIGDPSKLNKKEAKAQAIVGSSQIVAGSAIAVGTGVGTAKVVREASSEIKQSKGMYRHARKMFKINTAIYGNKSTFAHTVRTQQMAEAVKLGKSGIKKFRSRGTLLLTGATFGGAMLMTGFEKVRAAAKKEKPTSGTFSKATGEAIGVGLAGGAYYHHLPVGSFLKTVANTYALYKGKPRPFKATWWK